MKKSIEKSIEVILSNITKDTRSRDAVYYSHAALNLVDALGRLERKSLEEETSIEMGEHQPKSESSLEG